MKVRPEWKMWSLDKTHKITELIAAVAVIISLIFVGLQVKQNTTAVQSAAAQAVHENFSAWYMAIQNEPMLLDIAIKGTRDYATLTETERAQFIAIYMSFYSYTQNAYYKWREGSLAPDLWRSWEYVSMIFLSTPGGKVFWAERSYLFADAFQHYVEQDLMKRDPHPLAKPWGASPVDKDQ
jgi:hypothetical protein